MKETIHYISDISYFSKITSTKYHSKQHMLSSHIRYIKKSAEYIDGDEKLIIQKSRELDKKENSRIAFKFHMAIPNDISDYKNFVKEVKQFLSEQFNIDEKYIYIAVHTNHRMQSELQTQNKHIHIVANTQTREGKQIRIQPKDLRQLHKDWDMFLEKRGYIVKKEKDAKIGHIGRAIHYDPELQQAYKEYLLARQELAQAQKTPSPNYSQSEPEPVRATRQPEPQRTEPQRTEPVHKEPEPTKTPPKPPTKQPIQKDKEFAMRLSVASTTDRKPHPTQFVERNVRTLSEIKEVIKSSYYSNIIWDTGYRSGKNAKAISNFIVFDVDGTDRIEKVYEMLKQKGIRALITTTKSHTEQEHHFRVIIKTSRELQETELLYYKQLMNVLATELGIMVDRSAFDLARMYAPNPTAKFAFVDGKELNIDGYIQQAKELYEFEMQQTFTKQVSYKQKKQEQHWIYVDFDALVNVDIEDLIDHFENIRKKWKEGSQIYVRTAEGDKYSINKDWNVAYNFHEMKGYGVINYLQEKLQTTHLLNIARYLQNNHLATGLIVLNEEVFNEKINKCIDKAWDMDEFIELAKQEFNVKSVFLDLQAKTIKIGQFKIELDDEMHEKLVDAFVPKGKSPGRTPRL